MGVWQPVAQPGPSSPSATQPPSFHLERKTETTDVQILQCPQTRRAVSVSGKSQVLSKSSQAALMGKHRSLLVSLLPLEVPEGRSLAQCSL